VEAEEITVLREILSEGTKSDRGGEVA
jgi:hypothetical protein